MDSVIDILRRSPLFARLPAEDLMRMAAEVRPRRLAGGELVFREGEPCQGFYLVSDGTVRVFKIAPDGRERTLHIVQPPHSFAEAAMFLPQGYPAFAAAQEPSHVLLVPREAFSRLLRDRPDTALRVFESLSTWLHRLLDQLENETFLKARTRLAVFLLREARRRTSQAAPVTFLLEQPKKTLASQLGITPETLSRSLAALEAQNLIQVTGRSITIPDIEALQEAILVDTL